MKITAEAWDRKYKNLAPQIKKTALKLARFLGQKDVSADIYLVNNRFMKKNVLAFPAPKAFPRPDLKKKTKALGEIYLNPAYIKKEHLEIGDWKLEFPAKLDYMLIHGFLHLLGYDHKRKSDRIRMEKKEQVLLKKL